MKQLCLLLFVELTLYPGVIINLSETEVILKISYIDLETNEYASRYFFKKNNSIWYSGSHKDTNYNVEALYQTLEARYVEQKKIRAFSNQSFSSLKYIYIDGAKIFFDKNNRDELFFLPY